MPGRISRPEDLVAYKKAYALTLEIYRVTKSFPQDERFGLTQQLRRAGVAVPSLIAEGFGRQGTRDFLRFLDMARGSAREVETQLRLAFDLNYFNSTELIGRSVEVIKVLNGLIQSLRRQATGGPAATGA